jgi:hypothetical protein
MNLGDVGAILIAAIFLLGVGLGVGLGWHLHKLREATRKA